MKKIVSVIILIIALCFVGQGQVSAKTLTYTDKNLINAILNDFKRLCVENNYQDNVALMTDNPRYPSHGKSDLDGELWVSDLLLKKRYGYDVTIRAHSTRCQLAIWPNTHHLYEPLKKSFEALNIGYKHRNLKSSDQTEYRDDSWEYDDRFYETRISEFKEEGGFIVIGMYKQKRKGHTDYIADSSARWTARTIETYDDTFLWRTTYYNKIAEIRIREHRLFIQNESNGPCLYFQPIFYSFMAKDKDGKIDHYYYMEQSAMFIDGKRLPAYTTCANGENGCEKNGYEFKLPLDEKTLDMIRKGKEFDIKAKTTYGENFWFTFPLTGAARAIKQMNVGTLVDNGDGTLSDPKTGLMWAAKCTGEEMDWSTASSYCENYTRGGYGNWRLPNPDELQAVSYHSVPSWKQYDVWTSLKEGSRVCEFSFRRRSALKFEQSWNHLNRALPVRSGDGSMPEPTECEEIGARIDKMMENIKRMEKELRTMKISHRRKEDRLKALKKCIKSTRSWGDHAASESCRRKYNDEIDEVSELTDSINEMASDLNSTNKRRNELVREYNADCKGR